jgi:hypothetical protein
METGMSLLDYIYTQHRSTKTSVSHQTSWKMLLGVESPSLSSDRSLYKEVLEVLEQPGWLKIRAS